MTALCPWKKDEGRDEEYVIMSVMDTNAIVRRDRRVVVFGIAAVTTLAWVYLALMTIKMGQDMRVGMKAAAQPRLASWTVIDFVLMFIMWAVMMVAMMLPSASPMVAMFAKVNRMRRTSVEAVDGDPMVPTWVFMSGYIVMWSGFSLLATILQWALQNAGLLSPMMASTSTFFGGLILIAAGAYQWSVWKQSCLNHCQTPLGFLMTRWQDGRDGAFRMGLSHGAYCVGCCWMLMALLFVGGVMNLAWVAALAALVLTEKLMPPGLWLSRITGSGLIVWGSTMIVGTYY